MPQTPRSMQPATLRTAELGLIKPGAEYGNPRGLTSGDPEGDDVRVSHAGVQRAMDGLKAGGGIAR